MFRRKYVFAFRDINCNLASWVATTHASMPTDSRTQTGPFFLRDDDDWAKPRRPNVLEISRSVPLSWVVKKLQHNGQRTPCPEFIAPFREQMKELVFRPGVSWNFVDA